MHLAYGISDRLDLSIGVGLSMKRYHGNGDAFTNQAGWMMGVEPEDMKAKCTVLDIPALVTFYAKGRNRNGVFFQGGMSSYVVQSEWYGFEYSNADLAYLTDLGMSPVDEINIEENRNNHWIGALHLGVGYQKVLGKNYSVRITPYTRIPLTGIGEGEVDLYSSGLNFSVWFR